MQTPPTRARAQITALSSATHATHPTVRVALEAVAHLYGAHRTPPNSAMFQEPPGAASDGRPLRRVIEDAVRIVPEPEGLPRTTSQWLESSNDEYSLAHLLPIIGGEELASLCQLLSDNRPRFLAHLKSMGVARLADRQKLANALGRDRREGLVWLQGESPPHRQKPSRAKPQLTPPRVGTGGYDTVQHQSGASVGERALPPPVRSPPIQPSSTANCAHPRREVAAVLEDDAVMGHIHRQQPVSAWREARGLADSPSAALLRARALVLLGSLVSAEREYMECVRQAATAALEAGGAGHPTAVVAAPDASGAEEAARDRALKDPLVTLAKAEAAQLFGLRQALDALGVALHFFHPRRVPRSLDTSAASGSRDGTCATGSVDPHGTPIEVGWRLWPMRPSSRWRAGARGLILHHHGNGEVASDYDAMAELWHLMGVHLLVVDFRGYGWSTTDESARTSAFLSDAEALVGPGGGVRQALRACGLLPPGGGAPSAGDGLGMPTVLFGRSMGSNVAVHLAACEPASFEGLIFESGIASARALRGARGQGDVGAALPTPPGGVKETGLMENEAKLREIAMPLLVLHGGADSLVPPEQARLAHAASLSHRKTLKIIDGAGHNDIGMAQEYWSTIATFLDEVLVGSRGAGT